MANNHPSGVANDGIEGCSPTRYSLQTGKDWLTDKFTAEHGEVSLSPGHYLPCATCPCCGRGGTGQYVPAAPTERLVDKLRQFEYYAFLPLDEFLKLRELAEDEIGVKYRPWLTPGAQFPVARWEVRSRSRKDVYLPFQAVFVSEQFVEAYRQNELSGIAFFRADLGAAENVMGKVYQAVVEQVAPLAKVRCKACHRWLQSHDRQADRIKASRARSHRVIHQDGVVAVDLFFSVAHSSLVASERFVKAMEPHLTVFKIVPLRVVP